MIKRRVDNPFTSRMSRAETIAALVYLPIHVLLLPWLMTRLLGDSFSSAEINFICYAVGVLYMLVCAGRFLRRDFDPLCDNLLYILLEVIICYGLMLASTCSSTACSPWRRACSPTFPRWSLPPPIPTTTRSST